MNVFFRFRKLNLLQNFKLQHKLLISYLLLIVIPMSIFMYLSYDRVNNVIESVLKYSAEQSFQQSAAFISKKAEYATSVANIVIRDKKVQLLLAEDQDANDISAQLGKYMDITDLQNMYTSFEDIYRIRYYADEKKIYINGYSFFSMEKAMETEWYKNLLDNSGNLLFYYFDNKEILNEEATISCLRFVKDETDLSRNLGIVRVDINQNDIQDILDKSVSTPNSRSFIIGSGNSVFSTSSKGLEEERLKNYNLYKSILNDSPLFFSKYKIGTDEALLGCKRIANTGLILVTVIPYDEILAGAREVQRQLLLFLLVLSAAAYFVAYLISASIVKRVKVLTRSMKKLQEGELGTVLRIQGNDEIAELMYDYNYMSEKLSHMVKEQFRIGQEAKSYELKALQGQINPHFLYNTLDLINWTAINNNVPQISSLVKSLSKFYKLSLNKGSDIISIKDELEHVRIYMEIQNQRFEDAFEFLIEADEKVYEYSTLKIILQPIVENSVLHGILRKESKTGTIKIKVSYAEDKIYIDIEDNGKGMDEQQLEKVLSNSAERSQGYGIRNINDRIKLNYGDEYGLSYSSELNAGTTVRVIIPAVRMNGN